MIRIGIDTSVLIGLLDPKDVWHGPAKALKQALITHDASIALFDCVLAEAISTVACRIQEQRRASELDDLLTHMATEYPIEDSAVIRAL